LLGRPVVTGERILEIADPASIELRIDVPISDALTVRNDAPVKAFFDADPLNARGGLVRHADYQARLIAGDVMAYRVLASLDTSAQDPPRLGARGTAQLYGERVPLLFYLFRRPIAAVRQRIGL
jgi:hypothetical protein